MNADAWKGLAILIGLVGFIAFGVWRSKRRAEILLLIGTLLVCGLSLLWLRPWGLFIVVGAVGFYFGQRKLLKAHRR